VKIRRVVAGSFLLALVAAGAAGGWAVRELRTPHAGWTGHSVDVILEPGLSARSMFQRLAERGVIRHPGLLRLWVRYRDDPSALHAGEYRFDRPRTPLGVLDMLRRGDVLLHSVTLPEGLELPEIAQRVAEAGFGPAEALLAVFDDPAPIIDLDPEATDLEGYLFPDTYRFPRHTTPATIAGAMVERFRAAAVPEIVVGAERLGLSLREAVVLASLIEKETSVPEERGRISRVFHNRLELGMRLQCDPTVRYALLRAGRPVGKLTFRDLEFESPWNTYRIFGLPRGPIASPGLASLLAAVKPPAGDDLYFVAAPGGGHRFSRNLAGHQAAVAEWRRYSRSSR